MISRPSMEKTYLMFAAIISERSTCIRLKTGTVITSIDMRRIFSIGYNGTPHGMSHDCTSKEGTCGCLHAEINALLKKNTAEEGIMFSTHSPCITCARYILQSNVSKLYYVNEYRDIEPILLLKNQGVLVNKYII